MLSRKRIFEIIERGCSNDMLSVTCSCWMCRGFEYDRKENKKETLRIIRESME